MAAVVLGTRDVPAEPAQVASARHWLTYLLARDHPAVVDEVVLLACEIITNAIRHTASATVLVAVHEIGDAIRTEVTDAGSPTSVPRIAQDDPEALNGRGLRLVDVISKGRWGSYADGNGQTVWFEITPMLDRISPWRPNALPIR